MLSPLCSMDRSTRMQTNDGLGNFGRRHRKAICPVATPAYVRRLASCRLLPPLHPLISSPSPCLPDPLLIPVSLSPLPHFFLLDPLFLVPRSRHLPGWRSSFWLDPTTAPLVAPLLPLDLSRSRLPQVLPTPVLPPPLLTSTRKPSLPPPISSPAPAFHICIFHFILGFPAKVMLDWLDLLLLVFNRVNSFFQPKS